MHSQFCSSGDNTLEACEDAIKSAENEADDYDENFVIVLSDANLERYGIPAKELGRILNLNPEVKAFAIFIGSLGDQAERLIFYIYFKNRRKQLVFFSTIFLKVSNVPKKYSLTFFYERSLELEVWN